MAVQAHLYQLFHPRPSGALTSKDALVSALWRRLFPGKYFGPNHRLDQIFVEMSHFPDRATRPLGQYYFDQVTYTLPTRHQVKHRESCNLQLHCFDSWADLKQERQRATERHGRLRLSTNRDTRPSTGIRLTGLGQLQNPNTGRSITTKEYIYMMYGHSC